MKRPNKIIVLLLGMVVGIAGVMFVGTAALNIYRNIKKPKRYDANKLALELKGPSIQKDLKIFIASSLDRIFLDGKTLEKPAYSLNAKVFAARNEYESFQLVIESPSKDRDSVAVTTYDLVDPKTGAKIPKANFTVRPVGYVPTGEPYYPVKFVGMWPDPLMPSPSVDIKAGTTQPFWLTIYVPPTTPPGDYTGTVEVKGEGMALQSIPVNVHVYDFTLPQESQLKTAFDFYGHITKLRYPRGEKESDLSWQSRINEINEKFLIEMLKYRMNPILNIDPTVPADLGRIDRYRRYGINNFSIGKRGGTFNNNWPTDDESINGFENLYRTYGEMLKLNGMLQYAYIYTWDEGPLDNPLVPKIAGMIHRAYKGLKNMVCYHGFWDPKANPEWGKDIDIWTFNVDDFKEDQMRALQKLGIEMWMYISGPSGFGSPNLAIDFSSIDYRITPWLCWKYDIKGFLYWCVNWWEKADPFLTAVNTDWEQNGNGLLFYPGENGPVASIRAEVFRDGMEDYEYIQTLIKRIQQIQIMKLDTKYAKEINESVKLMTVDPTIAASMFQFTKDGELLKARRDAIARTIEEFNQRIAQAQPSTEPPLPVVHN